MTVLACCPELPLGNPHAPNWLERVGEKTLGSLGTLMDTTDFEHTLSLRVLYPVCSMSQNEFDPEELMEAVAEGLNRTGVRAFPDEAEGDRLCRGCGGAPRM